MSDEQNSISNTDSRLDPIKATEEVLASMSQNEDHMVLDSDSERQSPKPEDAETPSDVPALRDILKELSQLRVFFSKRFSYDRTKEKAFERLYEEFAELKRNAAFENAKSLFLDLILLYDRMESLQEELELSPEGRGSLRSLRNELLEVLSRQEINFIETKHAMFDPEQQQAVGTEKVHSADESGKVVRVVRRGFRYRERLLRPEEVIVTTYEKKNSNSGATFDPNCRTNQKTNER